MKPKEEVHNEIDSFHITSLGKLPHGHVIYASVAHRIVDEVIDSIGSCSECVNFDDGTNDCYRMWSISCSDLHFEDWFCADFERKANA